MNIVNVIAEPQKSQLPFHTVLYCTKTNETDYEDGQIVVWK